MTVSRVIVTKRQSLLRSTTLVSTMTLLSRVMGFIRDIVFAHFFGAQAGMDAFLIAFRIPNFMRRLFAEGAFSQAFVPVLSEYQKTRESTDVRQFISRIFGHLSLILSIVTVIGIIAAPVIIFIFAPGFGQDSTRALLATEMLRLTFPYLLFISITAMLGAVLNTYGYFAIPAVTPVLLNVSLIFAAVLGTIYFSPAVKALAWGVLIAGILQFLFQLPFLHHRNLLVKPSLFWGDPGVNRVLKLMVPALFGVSVAQVNLMVDSIFASFLKVGSVSWLYYSDRLTDFPLGVFGVAIATVILPHLSRRHADKNQEQFSSSLDWALRMMLLIGVPSAVGLVVFSGPVISVCFGYGKFSFYDVIMTQKSLIALALGIPSFMMVKILASGFYARQNIKTPVKVGALAMLVNTVLCAVLIWPLAHAGLALSSSLAGYFNCLTLLYLLIRRNIFKPAKGWIKFSVQLLIANTCMVAYLLWMHGQIEFWFSQSLYLRLAYLFGNIVLAGFIYFIVLMLTGVRLAQFRNRLNG